MGGFAIGVRRRRRKGKTAGATKIARALICWLGTTWRPLGHPRAGPACHETRRRRGARRSPRRGRGVIRRSRSSPTPDQFADLCWRGGDEASAARCASCPRTNRERVRRVGRSESVSIGSAGRAVEPIGPAGREKAIAVEHEERGRSVESERVSDGTAPEVGVPHGPRRGQRRKRGGGVPRAPKSRTGSCGRGWSRRLRSRGSSKRQGGLK